MIFSLVAMIGLEKYCITSACLQWLCHSGERTVARGPLVLFLLKNIDCWYTLEPPHQCGSYKYPRSVLSRNMKTKGIFPLKFSFFGGKILNIFDLE